jgi:hypothetical protein
MSAQKKSLFCERMMEESYRRLLPRTTVLHAGLVKCIVRKGRYRSPVMRSESLSLLRNILRRKDTLLEETITRPSRSRLYLDTYDYKIPPELVRLVEVAVESGAALAGTLQTENIGIEKIIANVVANPNIRYVVLCWRESQGHPPADALINLVKNGVARDKRRIIIGAKAQSPYLPNISLGAIERFRKQVAIVNMISEDDPKFGMDPEKVRKAVWSCIQEKPTKFRGHTLYDPDAWPEPPICQKITIRITEPWRPELSEKEAGGH